MTQRLVRWVLFLSKFNFIIVYHFGSTNGKANTLYLRPDYTLSNNDSSFSDTSFTVLRSENLCAITSLVTFLICLDNIAFASLDNIQHRTLFFLIILMMYTFYIYFYMVFTNELLNYIYITLTINHIFIRSSHNTLDTHNTIHKLYIYLI